MVAEIVKWITQAARADYIRRVDLYPTLLTTITCWYTVASVNGTYQEYTRFKTLKFVLHTWMQRTFYALCACYEHTMTTSPILVCIYAYTCIYWLQFVTPCTNIQTYSPPSQHIHTQIFWHHKIFLSGCPYYNNATYQWTHTEYYRWLKTDHHWLRYSCRWITHFQNSA